MKRVNPVVMVLAAMSFVAFAPFAQAQNPIPASPLLPAKSVKAGSDMLYVSGQIAAPIDPSKPISAALTAADMGDTQAQTISALTKMKAILETRGYAMADVVKVTVFLTGDPAKGGKWDFAGMNQGFAQFFGTADNPNAVSRSTVQVVAVAHPAFLVEIDAIAARQPGVTSK